MPNLLPPHERYVVSVKGDVQTKLREESEALGIGRHRAKTKLVLAPAITDPSVSTVLLKRFSDFRDDARAPCL
jgi:hypothetical protein